MENPVSAVTKKYPALRAAVPVTLGVLLGGYLIVSMLTGSFNPKKWASRPAPSTPDSQG